MTSYLGGALIVAALIAWYQGEGIVGAVFVVLGIAVLAQ